MIDMIVLVISVVFFIIMYIYLYLLIFSLFGIKILCILLMSKSGYLGFFMNYRIINVV